jgi:hypothetical protein
MFERKSKKFSNRSLQLWTGYKWASLFLFDQILTKQNKTDPNSKEEKIGRTRRGKWQKMTFEKQVHC